MTERPLVVGLTGSIGMGKTETAKMFASLGFPVFNADAAVHALYEKGGAAVGPVGEAFPGTVKDGGIDRQAMAVAVAKDPAAFVRLEAIVHPLVEREEKAFIAAAAAKGAELAVLDIPMLYETGREKRMDAVVVASAPAGLQHTRVLARSGMTEERLAMILRRQMPDAEKRARADFVVDTSQGLERAFEQVKRIVQELRRRREQNDA